MIRHRQFFAHLLACGALFALAGNGAAADDSVDGQVLLERFLTDVDSMTARFEQTLVDANDEELESSSGTMQIRRPGQFRWTYTEPYEQILVADGLNLWSYDVDLEQVTVKAQAAMLANTPAMLLGGTRSVLDEFEVIDTDLDRGTAWVRLRPRNPDNGFDQVELGFDDGVLRRMIFSDSLEQKTVIALVEVGINEPLEDSFFEFSVPSGVDLVGEPLVADLTDHDET